MNRNNNIIFLILLFFLIFLILSSCKPSVKKYTLVVIQYTKRVPSYVFTYNGIVEGLKDKGYIDGLNLKIYFFLYLQKNLKKNLPLEKILKLKKDLIVTLGTIPTKFMLSSLPIPNKIPLVFTIVLEPKCLQLTKEKRKLLNVTGLGMKLPVRTQLYLIKEALPRIKSLGLFYSIDYPQCVYLAQEIKENSSYFKLKVYEKTFSNITDLEKIKTLSEQFAKKVDVIYITDPFAHTPKVLKKIVEGADKYSVPVIGINKTCVNFGALIGIHCDFFNLGYMTSDVIDSMLKGYPAYKIPIQYPKTFRITLNMRKAKQLGIQFSRNFILRSDHILY